jgi:TfoX/Sxy family transcriptional regulator of competence genes
MPGWTKSPASLVALFAEIAPQGPGVTHRKMFGYPAAFVNGNMFAGLFQDGMIVRLGPEARAAVEAEHGPHPFAPMEGRVMKDYMRVPDAVLEDETATAGLLAKALAHASGLPPKEKKPKRARP